MTAILVVVSALAVLLAGCGEGPLPEGCWPRIENEKYCLDYGDGVVVETSGGDLELFRVVAMRDIVVKFPGRKVVKVAGRGDRGGYIQGEWNLSVDGAAWVGDEAKVFARANVSQNAFVYGKAQISGTARIYENALVYGSARVLDSAKVHGRAEVSGNAMVFNLAETVFEPDDPVHKIWTNSFHGTDQCHFRAPIDWVTSDTYLQECEARIGTMQGTVPQSNDLTPTEIGHDALVNGNARVWGGSRILWNGLVTDNARVSRQTTFSGKLCGNIWQNTGGSSGIISGPC